jgi:enamine deaminase RidA (YjgF/YER057c/UK114 family)
MYVLRRQNLHRRNGSILHPDDISAQLVQSLDNLETVLERACANLTHVVRLNYYNTDVDGLLKVWPLIVERLRKVSCRPASTVLGVARLAFSRHAARN